MKILSAILLAIVACGLVHAQKVTDPTVKSMGDALRAEGNNHIFLDLLQTAGQGFPIGFLPKVSAGIFDTTKTAQYTILAPTDAAFAQLPAGTIEKLKSDPAKLREFLMSYIVPGRIMIADMLVPTKENATTTRLDATSMDGAKVSFLCNAHSGDHHPRINDVARIGKADIPFYAGVIHQIDRLLHINPFQ